MSTRINNRLKPIRIHKKELKQLRANLDTIVLSIINCIKNYHYDESSFFYGQKELTEFANMSKYGDYLGPVVRNKNDYYKCIRKRSLDDFKKLWKTGIVQVLGDLGWIPKHVISNYRTDEYPIILKIDTLDLLTYIDFDLDIAKSEVVFIALLNQVLTNFGYTLHDAHYDNTCVIYKDKKPKMIYIDVGSIIKIDTDEKSVLSKGVSQIEINTDIDAVMCGCYRLLFSYFNDSLLSKFELSKPRKNEKIYSFHLYFEHRFYRRRYFFYHLFHSSFCVTKAVFHIFKNLKISPIDSYVLFLYNNIGFEEFVELLPIKKEWLFK